MHGPGRPLAPTSQVLSIRIQKPWSVHFVHLPPSGLTTADRPKPAPVPNEFWSREGKQLFQVHTTYSGFNQNKGSGSSSPAARDDQLSDKNASFQFEAKTAQ
jgi:hypothetical protein